MNNELRISEAEYQEMLKKAEEAGACRKDLEILKGLSLAEALGNEGLPFWLYWYARHVIKGRWPEAEPVIIKDAESACCYARFVIKGRWPEAEEIIKEDPWYACYYARRVIKGRWPEAEGTISKSAEWSYSYARDVIGCRWPEAEATISKDSKWSYWYKDIKNEKRD